MSKCVSLNLKKMSQFISHNLISHPFSINKSFQKSQKTSKHFWHIAHIHRYHSGKRKKKRLFLTKVIACSRFKNSQRLLVVGQATWRAEKRCWAWLLRRFEAPSVYNSVVMNIGVRQWHEMIRHRFVLTSASRQTVLNLMATLSRR